jgi:hypothetical protein
VDVRIKQKVAVLHFDLSTQVYFLAERIGGEFGSGTGEEFTDSDPDNPEEGVYIPIWMPIGELPLHEKVFPESVAKLLLNAQTAGWSDEAVIVKERSK